MTCDPWSQNTLPYARYINCKIDLLTSCGDARLAIVSAISDIATSSRLSMFNVFSESMSVGINTRGDHMTTQIVTIYTKRKIQVHKITFPPFMSKL